MSTNRGRGSILEEEVLDDLQKIDENSRLTCNSGALRGDGDIHTSEFCIDTKLKSNAKNYIATCDEVRAAEKQGLRSGRKPAIIVENSKEGKVAVLPYETFLEVVERIEELKDDIADLKISLECEKIRSLDARSDSS
jgi:hypothetical protein